MRKLYTLLLLAAAVCQIIMPFFQLRRGIGEMADPVWVNKVLVNFRESLMILPRLILPPLKFASKHKSYSTCSKTRPPRGFAPRGFFRRQNLRPSIRLRLRRALLGDPALSLD
jgi:hypothetical protein